MKKDVFITINSTHKIDEERDEESDHIEMIVPGSYTFCEGKHRITYEEPVEGVKGIIRNTLIIDEAGMEIIKEGLASSHMSFLKSGKKTSSKYSTPYGDIIMGIKTFDLHISEGEDKICVDARYSLEMGGEYVSICNLKVDICSKDIADIHL